MANTICWFDLAVANLDRAKTFYSKVLDKQLEVCTEGDFTAVVFPHSHGDGTTDVALTGGEGDAQASFEILTTILETMDIQHGLKKDLTGKLRQAQKELARQKPEKTIKKLDDIIKKLEEEIKKNIKHEEKEQKVSTEDARVLIEIVERLQANVVK